MVVLLVLAASIQAIIADKSPSLDGEYLYTSYNNYTIFERSFHNLKDNKDLYNLNLEYHWDLYKYTPTFAAFFGFFSIFPFWIGIVLWNLLNAFVLFFAIYYLPRLNKLEKGLVILILLVELMTTIQNEQSNALIAGLLVFSFGLLERNKYLITSLLVVSSVFIKLFGIVGFALFIFYPKKWKLALYTILWTVVLFLIPLMFVDFNQYIKLYQSYWNMLAHDHLISYGYSMIGWLYSWFCLDINKNIIVIVGAFVFLIPLIRIKEYKYFSFRYLLLTSILIWIVIFNHKAESSTFIIAMTGVSLWFIKNEKTTFNIILFVGAIIFTSLSPTDLFPRIVQEEYIIPYTLNAFPCILIWIKIIFDGLTVEYEKLEKNVEPKIKDALD